MASPATPPVTTRRKRPRAPEDRLSWTLKGAKVTPEFRALAARAAAAHGETLSAFVVDVVTRAAQARLKGEPDGTEAGVPVIVPPMLEARLAAIEVALLTRSGGKQPPESLRAAVLQMVRWIVR